MTVDQAPLTSEVAQRRGAIAGMRRSVLLLLTLALALAAVLADQAQYSSSLAKLGDELVAEVDRARTIPHHRDVASWLQDALDAQPPVPGRSRFGIVNGSRVTAGSGEAVWALGDADIRAAISHASGKVEKHRTEAGGYLMIAVEAGPGARLVLLQSLRPLEEQRSTRLLWFAGAAVALLTLGLLGAEVWRHRYVTAPLRPRKDDNRPLRVVVTEGFWSRLAFGLISFALPLYAHRLGMSLSLIGVLLTTNIAVAVVLKPFMGMVIDRIGVRNAYIAAVGLRTCVVLSLVFATTPAHLFLARGLHGVAIALRDPSSSTVLAALGGKQAVAQRFAWYQTAKTVAGAAGGFSSGLLLTALGGDYSTVFLISAILSGLPMVLVLTGLRGPQVRGLVVPRQNQRAPMPLALKQALLPYAVLGGSMSGTAYLMSNLLPVLAVSHMGLSEAAASSLYAFTAVVSLSGPVWGWVADRVSLRLVLGVRAIGNVLSSLLWLVFPSYSGLVLGKVTDDLGKAAFRPAWGAVMANVSALDPARRSQTLAMMSTAEDVGELGAPILAGVIWSTLGLPALLLIRAGAGLATEVYAWSLGRRINLTDQ